MNNPKEKMGISYFKDPREKNAITYFIVFNNENKIKNTVIFYKKKIDTTEDIVAITNLLNQFYNAEGDITIINFIKLNNYKKNNIKIIEFIKNFFKECEHEFVETETTSLDDTLDRKPFKRKVIFCKKCGYTKYL